LVFLENAGLFHRGEAGSHGHGEGSQAMEPVKDCAVIFSENA